MSCIVSRKQILLEDFALELLNRSGTERLIVGIAGPPGAGKSTFCNSLMNRLSAAQPGICAIVPMDGFHFDDTYLDEKGWRARKGAPHTFDVGGLLHCVKRLRENDEDFVAVPVFDRELEVARAGARVVSQSISIVLVEGNYLLLKDKPWQDIAKHFDVSAMLCADIGLLEQRLAQRWVDQGMGADEIAEKLGENDLPNVHLVLKDSVGADFELRTD